LEYGLLVALIHWALDLNCRLWSLTIIGTRVTLAAKRVKGTDHEFI
jgi:hypothetical protein